MITMSSVRVAQGFLRFFIGLCIGILGFSSLGFSLTKADALIRQSRSLQIGKDLAWRRILFIGPAWFDQSKSIIDDPKFFFAQDGLKNPQSELEATLRAFVETDLGSLDSMNKHPICRFPARYHHLKFRLPELENYVVPIECSAFENFWQEHRFKMVSLVFTAYYANNPASTFGHTFLRLHRLSTRKGRQSALLDSAINFSAVIRPGINPIIYTYKGLTGGFDGNFFFVPYYEKVQEYNNYDTRDLW